MTAFSLPSLPDPFKIDPIESGEALSIRPPRKIREAATDSIIRSNRAATPAAVADQRATKRLSIAELNAMDMPTLIDRYKAQRYDDRGAVTRFFDMLDMPRNVILSMVFPAIRRRKESDGDIGTFGLGNVHVSDVLDELGVDSRVIRGVLGFVGDAALDPLTYLGPAGWGGKIVGTGGKAIELTAEGRRALNAAVKAAARGRPVEDAAAGNILRAFGFGEDSLAASRASKSAADLERDIRAGIYGSQTTANKVGSAIGLDLQTRGSALADAFHATEETAQSVAARDFVKQYGRGSAKGLHLGVAPDAAKSYVAHLPFTSYGVFVPGFTGEALQAATILDRANAGFSEANAALGDSVGRVRSLRDEAESITRGVRDGTVSPADAEARRAVLEAQLKEATFEDSLNPAAPQNRLKSVADVMKQHEEYQKAMAELEALRGEARDTLETRDLRNRIVKDIGDTALTGNLDAMHQSLLAMPDEEVARMEALADSLQTEIAARGHYANAIGGTLAEAMKDTDNAAIARVAAEMMGAGVEVGGYGLFDTARNVARRTMGDDKLMAQTVLGKIDSLSEASRRMFGSPDGQAKRYLRTMEAQSRNIAEQAHRATYEPMVGEIKQALSDAGISTDRWREASEAATALAYLARDPTGEQIILDSPELLAALKRARDAGLGPAFDKLTEIAKKYQGILDDFTDEEWLTNVLRDRREAYIFSPTTREGAEYFQGLREGQGPITRETLNHPEGFNRPRVTDKAQWVGADGVKRGMYRNEYDYYRAAFLTDKGDLRENAIDLLRSAGIKGNPEFWDAVRRGEDVSQMLGSLSPAERKIYDAMEYTRLSPEMRLGPAKFKQVDPFTKNVEFPQMFSISNPGQAFPRGMFETSLADIQAKRTAYHEAARIRDQFQKVAAQWALPVQKLGGVEGNLQTLATLGVGTPVRFRNGATGRIVKSGGDFVIDVGGHQYRKLRNVDDAEQALRAFGSGTYNGAIDLVYPVHVAEALERFAQTVKSPAGILKAYDEFLRIWKGMTLAHPSWIIGDVIGGVFQAMMSGTSPAKFTARIKDAIRLSMAADKPEVLRALNINLHGMKPEEFVREIGKMNGMSGHAHGIPVAEMLANGVEMPGYTTPLTQPVGRFREMKARAAARTDSMARTAAMMGIEADAKVKGKPVGSWLKNAAYAKHLVIDEGMFHHVFRPFFAANGRANDAIRLANILALMDDGHDLAGATMKTVEALFDVSDLTHFENSAMKRLLPFYSWMKHSGTYWAKRMLENPAMLSIAPRLERAIEESLYGDQTIPQHMRPNWMRDQLALQIGADPDTRYSLTLGTLLPTETATAIGAAAMTPAVGWMGLKQLAEQAGFGMNVPLKMLAETASGRELFSGREIGFNPDQGDLSVGEYLAGQIRPLREFGVGNIRQGPIQKAAKAGVVPLASRVALGGRSQPFDDERIRQNMLRQYKQDEQSIRKRITIAEREGNAEASGNARARLLRLYTEMIQKGVGDAVPAWARKQLEQVAGGM